MKFTSKYPLNPLLEQVQQDPFFLGWVMNHYAHSYGMKKREIAKLLKCSIKSLSRLALCRLPNGADPEFANHVKRIGEYVGCDSRRLASMIREIVTVDLLAGANIRNGEGFLMAARDRREKDNDEKNK
jgi:hypothetical protein